MSTQKSINITIGEREYECACLIASALNCSLAEAGRRGLIYLASYILEIENVETEKTDMDLKEITEVKPGDIVILRDKGLYDGKEFTVLERKGDSMFFRLQMVERPVIVKTVHYKELERSK